ncbi:MAG TPA: HU family DNA-binding protein [bacterium]|nr:HU family DNA-binding protein [bacterium]
MTKADIVDLIAERTGLTKVETAAVVDGFMATVQWAMERGERVELRGFGTFCLRERREKHVPNPKTGTMMNIPHRIVPDFKPSPQMKKAVADTMKETGKFIPEKDAPQTELFRDWTDINGFFNESNESHERRD